MSDPYFERSERSGPLGTAILYVLRVTTAGGLLAAAAGSLLGFIGERWWVFDLLSHFRVQYAIYAGISGACFALVRRWWLAACAFGVLSLNAALVAPLWIGRNVQKASPELDLIVFNLGAERTTGEEIGAYLKERSPDVIILLELLPDRLVTIQGMLPDYKVVARARPDHFGIGALVRDGLFVDGSIESVKDFPVVQLSIAKDNVRFALLGIHPPPPLTEEMSLMRDEVLVWATAWVGKQSVPVIVAGDLNASPWSHPFRALLDGGRLVDSQAGYGLQASWPSSRWWQSIPIDHCLHSESLTTVARRLGPAHGSDHLPVEVRLAPITPP